MPLKTTVQLAHAIPSDKVTVTTRITNQRTGEVVADTFLGVEIPNYNAQTVIKIANVMADMWPDCEISVSVSNGDFICIPSRNMMRDENTMDFDDFMAKWYSRK